jgi:hypothetical protein
MMIIGKQSANSGWGGDAKKPYNIIINAGWDNNKLHFSYSHPRRMIIALSAPKVPGWIAPDNRISFSSSGFKQTALGNWPKFIGKFQVHYMPM